MLSTASEPAERGEREKRACRRTAEHTKYYREFALLHQNDPWTILDHHDNSPMKTIRKNPRIAMNYFHTHSSTARIRITSNRCGLPGKFGWCIFRLWRYFNYLAQGLSTFQVALAIQDGTWSAPQAALAIAQSDLCCRFMVYFPIARSVVGSALNRSVGPILRRGYR